MIVLLWMALAIADYILLLTVPFASIVIALTTKKMPDNLSNYSWGGIWGTYDSPPQGDNGYVTKRAPFPNVTDGWKGYINRVVWMIRNPLYGFSKKAGIRYSPKYRISHIGNPDISDKGRRPGCYLAKVHDGNRVRAFELYCVMPWGFGRCLRMRLGWKIMTDKFQRYGFAQFVDTVNPFDGYGDD